MTVRRNDRWREESGAGVESNHLLQLLQPTALKGSAPVRAALSASDILPTLILDDPIRPDLSFDLRRVLDWYESTRNRTPE
jgi:hypothetical protein